MHKFILFSPDHDVPRDQAAAVAQSFDAFVLDPARFAFFLPPGVLLKELDLTSPQHENPQE